MKHQAIVIREREVAELQPLEVPDHAECGHLFGRTVVSLMSPGTELAYNYLGKTFPSSPGYSTIFRVESIGDEVSDFEVGDLVFAMGRHQSFQHSVATETLKIPTDLKPEIAVLARLMGVSMTTLMTTTARPGDQVLVTGAGPVGFLAAPLFRIAGYQVSVVEPDEKRRELVTECGFQTYASIPMEEVSRQIALVVECSGHEQSVLDGCSVVRRRGEVVLVGVPWRKRTDLSAYDLLHKVFHNYVVLRSGWEWEIPRQSTPLFPHSNFDSFRLALKWLAEGRIQSEGQLQIYKPERAQEAYQANLHHRNTGLFTIFDWR